MSRSGGQVSSESSVLRALRGRLAALRPRDAFPAVMATPPTLAYVAPSGVNPVTSAVRVPFSSPRLTIVGGRLERAAFGSNQAGVQPLGNNPLGTASAGAYAVEFDVYSAHFALSLINRITATAASWVWVDGEPATAGGQTMADAASNGPAFLDVTFASAKWRRIRVVLWGFSLIGVELNPTDAIQPVRRPPFKVSVLGDSWTEYSTGTASAVEGWTHTLGRALGCEVFQHGQGGTGYSNPGAAGRAKYNDAARLQGIKDDNPDLVIVQGSSNDDGATATVPADAAAVFASLAPLPVFVVTPPSLPTNPAGRLTNRDAIRAAAAAAPNVIGMFDPLDVRDRTLTAAQPPAWTNGEALVAGDLRTYQNLVYEAKVSHTAGAGPSSNALVTTLITGTGKVGAVAGNGSADIMVANDATHPSQAGHDLFGRVVADAVLRTLNPLAVAA